MAIHLGYAPSPSRTIFALQALDSLIAFLLFRMHAIAESYALLCVLARSLVDTIQRYLSSHLAIYSSWTLALFRLGYTPRIQQYEGRNGAFVSVNANTNMGGTKYAVHQIPPVLVHRALTLLALPVRTRLTTPAQLDGDDMISAQFERGCASARWVD